MLSEVTVMSYDFLPIKPEKVADVRYLLKKCLLPAKVTFYDAVFGNSQVKIEYVE